MHISSKSRLLPTTLVIAAVVVAGLLVGARALQGATASKIVWEGENYTKIEAPFTTASKLNGASGNKYLHLPMPNAEAGPTTAKTTYKVRVPVAGKYTLWVRRYWRTGCGDSFSVSMDGGAAAIVGDEGDYDHWAWTQIKGKVYNLTADAHVVTVGQNAKDWGTSADQLVLLPYPTRYVPATILAATPDAIIK